MKWAGSWVISRSRCLFLFCSAAYFANLSSVKSVLCLAGTTLRDTCGAKDAMEGVELSPILDCEDIIKGNIV